jgi:hypothetical protein
MSVPHPNSTQTIDNPNPDAERTRSTPVKPFKLTSNGRVTNTSTSSGANPVASVITVTDGRFKSGNTSLVILGNSHNPTPAVANAKNKTIVRYRNDIPINQSNIATTP